jgi:serine/threonine-protein kinase RsbT
LPETDGEESCVLTIALPHDVERIRREARGLAARAGFNRVDAETVALAVSELAANLLRYAPGGEITVMTCSSATGRGIAIESRDNGPGIANVDLALQDGYSTSGGLGSGLPAVQRLMDDFALATGPTGTLIEAHKWLNPLSRLP